MGRRRGRPLHGVFGLNTFLQLLGGFVPLGLTLLGPVLVNILLYHIAFDPAGIGMGLVFTALWFIVFWQYKGSFRTVLSVDGS